MTRDSGRRTGASPSPELRVAGYARLDRGRSARVGVPEIVLGEGKSVPHLLGILRSLRSAGHGALVSRPTRGQLVALRRARELPLRFLAHDRLIRLEGDLGVRYRAGTVAVLTAGTSDVPLAEEAVALLTELGLACSTAFDVGVAGLHRLLRALRQLEPSHPEIFLVFAGREGALPTVVAGLVRAPVVGIPTSTGYGRGGQGEAALGAMLQSCAPIAVVNIDAGVPAALFAAQHFAVPGPRTRGRPTRPRRRSLRGR
jgi:pyridinium-3,5-biscarboxylic acid mononucleotide synthase